MGDKYELSVIMGVYNTADHAVLHRAISSILNQTYTDFELVICDDGSSDDTYRQLESYALLDSRIRLVRHGQNMGLAAALNTCISHAKGKFIARHDADDRSDPERFQRQMEFLEKHPEISVVGSNILLCDENGEAWGKRIFPEYPQKKDFLFTLPFVHGALIFRRECLVEAGGYRIARETRRCEDYDLLMRIYSLGMQGANLTDMYYWFTEDASAFKRRKYRYKIDEAQMRWKGFGTLGLMPQAIPYAIKPLIVGLIPTPLLRLMKKTRSF